MIDTQSPAFGEDALCGALADQVRSLLRGAAVHVRAGPYLGARCVVEHDSLAHAGRRHRSHVVPGGTRQEEGVAYAGRDREPVCLDVEVLATGDARRLMMGPLPKGYCYLLARHGE